MNWFSTLNGLVWMSLGALGCVTVYLIVERVLALWSRLAADELALCGLTAAWRRDCRIRRPARCQGLGWLGRLLAKGGSATDLWHRCDWERGEVIRFDGGLSAAASLGTALGLLGTFLALRKNSVGAADPAQVVGLGMDTSILGLVIAILATLADWLIRRRVVRLDFQTNAVMEALEEVLSAPSRRPIRTATARQESPPAPVARAAVAAASAPPAEAMVTLPSADDWEARAAAYLQEAQHDLPTMHLERSNGKPHGKPDDLRRREARS